MPDEFYGDETLITYHETPAFYLLAMSAKLMIFNAMKPSMKLPLRLALVVFCENLLETGLSFVVGGSKLIFFVG